MYAIRSYYAQTDYTVTASNAAGDTTTTIQITVEKKDLTSYNFV